MCLTFFFLIWEIAKRLTPDKPEKVILSLFYPRLRKLVFPLSYSFVGKTKIYFPWGHCLTISSQRIPPTPLSSPSLVPGHTHSSEVTSFRQLLCPPGREWSSCVSQSSSPCLKHKRGTIACCFPGPVYLSFSFIKVFGSGTVAYHHTPTNQSCARNIIAAQ